MIENNKKQQEKMTDAVQKVFEPILSNVSGNKDVNCKSVSSFVSQQLEAQYNALTEKPFSMQLQDVNCSCTGNNCTDAKTFCTLNFTNNFIWPDIKVELAGCKKE